MRLNPSASGESCVAWLRWEAPVPGQLRYVAMLAEGEGGGERERWDLIYEGTARGCEISHLDGSEAYRFKVSYTTREGLSARFGRPLLLTTPALPAREAATPVEDNGESRAGSGGAAGGAAAMAPEAGADTRQPQTSAADVAASEPPPPPLAPVEVAVGEATTALSSAAAPEVHDVDTGCEGAVTGATAGLKVQVPESPQSPGATCSPEAAYTAGRRQSL